MNWDSGEITWKPIKLSKKCDPFTLAKYAQEQNITNVIGYK